MKFWKIAALLLALLMLFSAASCRKQAPDQDTAPAQTTAPAENAVPTVEGVEDWGDADTTEPSTKPTVGQQTDDQQTGDQQTGNQQTGDQQTGDQQTGDQQTGNQTQTPPAAGTLTIEEYEAMTVSEQQAYFKSFDTVDAFYQWLEKAEQARKPGNTVGGDGTLDLEDYINNNR